MSQKTISSSDSGQQAAGKINDNFSELYNGQGGGGGGDNTVIGRNQDAVQRIYAAKKHVLESKTGSAGSSSIRNTTNNFCIAHGSDFHTDKVRWRNFLDFAEGVSGIQAIINTGDFAAQAGITEIDYMMDELDAANVTKPILLVAGNHDRYGITNAQLDGQFKMATRNTSIQTTDTNHLYYYVDFPNNNNEAGNGVYNGSDKPTPNIDTLRFIVLNQYDLTTTERSVIGVDFHYTQDQIDWFIDVLENTPATTAVIVAMHGKEKDIVNTGNKRFWQRHYQWNYHGATAYSGTIIEDIIEAFRTGVNINTSFAITNNDDATVTVATNFNGAGSFVCYMVGHSHHDMIGYSSVHPNQLYLMCPCSCLTPDYNNNGVLFGSGRYSYGNEVGDMPRVEGTRTQDCFNVYGIDTVNKIVKVVRVGSDINDLGQAKDMDYYDYQPTISNS